MKNTQNIPENICIIELIGRIDMNNAKEFENIMTKPLVNPNYKTVIFDCEKLEYLASAGLRSLLFAMKDFQQKKRNMVLCNVKKTIINVLDISGFTKLFNIKNNLEEAIALIK